LDEEVIMQGGDEREAEHQPNTRLENPEEPTPLNPTHENEIDMQEGGAGVKRGTIRVHRKPWQRQIEKKRRDKARFTRYYAGEL